MLSCLDRFVAVLKASEKGFSNTRTTNFHRLIMGNIVNFRNAYAKQYDIQDKNDAVGIKPLK